MIHDPSRDQKTYLLGRMSNKFLWVLTVRSDNRNPPVRQTLNVESDPDADLNFGKMIWHAAAVLSYRYRTFCFTERFDFKTTLRLP